MIQRLLVLFAALAACSGDATRLTRPELAAFNAECFEGHAAPPTEQNPRFPRICAFQDGMPAEISDNTAMGRLSVGCDSTKVRVEVQRRTATDKEFQEVACNAEEIHVELICNWHTTVRITALEFGDGTTEVVLWSICDTQYGGKKCLGSDNITPHANFGSTEGHCAVGDTFVIDNIAPGDELEAWADPID